MFLRPSPKYISNAEIRAQKQRAQDEFEEGLYRQGYLDALDNLLILCHDLV